MDGAPLDDLRVLDLSGGVAGQFASRILADWGADVVLVEPPGGAATRHRPPFRSDGRSLLFEHLNTSKRSMPLDLGTADGFAVLDHLVADADVVVTDGAHDLDRLRGVKPTLLATRITEFGSIGPYAAWRGSEMLHQALSGLMHTTGRQGGAPLFGFGQRAYYSAGAAAAAATLAAIRDRDRSGVGHLVELSVHEVAASMSQNLVTQYAYSGADPERGRYVGACGVFEAEGGWVVLFCPAGRWSVMCEAFGVTELVTDPRFSTFDRLVANWGEAMAELAPRFRSLDADALVAMAQAVRCMAAVVLTPTDVLTCEHLAARGYWEQAGDALVLGSMFRLAGVGRRVAPAPSLEAQR